MRPVLVIIFPLNFTQLNLANPCEKMEVVKHVIGPQVRLKLVHYN